ncbi:MAG TPA: sensor domain-containing protein, partial [Trebonia sp.]|nr:sensor domain-containing protein [Trebonia sp.]
MSLIRGLVSARTWLAFVHHLLGMVIGLVSVTVVVVFLTLGLALTPLALAGLPVIGIAVRFAGFLGCAESMRFATLLGREVRRWPADPRRGYRWYIVPTMSMMASRATWGEIGYAVLRLPASVIAVSLTTAVWAVGLVGVTLPLYAGRLPGGAPSFNGYSFA